ncbi:MAG: phosphotransferase [Actinomycetota bacterium]
MHDGRFDRWVTSPHLRLALRSSVAVAADASPAVKRRAVAAVQSGGRRGALLQRAIGVPFAQLPSAVAARLPRVTRTNDPGLAISDAAARSALTRADAVLDGSVTDVIWLIPPPSDGERVSALLMNGTTPTGHLRVTDLAPHDRPNPSSRAGVRTGIEWPMVLDAWEHDGVVVELTDAVDIGASHPTDLNAADLAELIADLHDALGEAPNGLVSAHGDLTPWNLRTTSDGRRVLFDWEHRTFAPPGYDLVRFLLASGDGPVRFGAMPSVDRRAARPAIEALIALADQRDASRDVDELTDWKHADIAAERTALEAMRDLAG